MAQLAIKGHVTRGKEVIEILEMLGGKNIHNYGGTFNECYIIDNNKICTIYTSVAKIDNCIIFTLEEFLEKFPYKVGAKVLINDDVTDVHVIKSMVWGRDLQRVAYTIETIDGFADNHFWFADEMEQYLEQKEKPKTNQIMTNNQTPQNVTDFRAIANELSDLYAKKNAAYGNSFGETFGKLGIISAITRISDKYNRLVNLTTHPDIDNLGESIDDTLMDTAAYCIMTLVELRKHKQNEIKSL
jgi:hypothetical protein